MDYTSILPSLITLSGILFGAGRFVGSLKRQFEDGLRSMGDRLESKIDANERVHTERYNLTILAQQHLKEDVKELKVQSGEKREELRDTIDERLAAMTTEIMRLRDDRHNTVGTVMRHEGIINEHGRQLAHLDTRVARIEQTP